MWCIGLFLLSWKYQNLWSDNYVFHRIGIVYIWTSGNIVYKFCAVAPSSFHILISIIWILEKRKSCFSCKILDVFFMCNYIVRLNCKKIDFEHEFSHFRVVTEALVLLYRVRPILQIIYTLDKESSFDFLRFNSVFYSTKSSTRFLSNQLNYPTKTVIQPVQCTHC